jgi:hypothetical protein
MYNFYVEILKLLIENKDKFILNTNCNVQIN